MKSSGKFRFTLRNLSRIITSRPISEEPLREDGFTLYPDFLDYYHSTFAFTPRGVFSGRFNLPHKQCARLVFCTVTDAIGHDQAYRMKRIIWYKGWRVGIAKEICASSLLGSMNAFHLSACTAYKLNDTMSISPKMPSNAFINVQLVVCLKCYADVLPTAEKRDAITGSYEAEMKNVGSTYPQLGFDETSGLRG